MARDANSSGGAVGVALAAVLVVLLAGSPFYFSLLRSDERALDAAIADDVEIIRRAVLNIDENLAELEALYAKNGAGATGKPSVDEKRLVEPFVKPIEDMAQVMRAVESRDADRGTKAPDSAPRIPTGLPGGDAAAAEMRNKYLKANDKLMQEAEQAASRIKSAAAGELTTTTHLGASHVLAVLRFTQGRIHHNRARMEQHELDMILADARERLLQFVDLRRAAATAEAARPTEIVDQLGKALAATEAALGQLDQGVAALSQIIAAKEQELARLREAAKSAQAALDKMDATPFKPLDPARAGEEFAAYQARYVKLAGEVRKAEAAAVELEQGALMGATLSDTGDEDWLLTAQYAGGNAEVGPDDLNVQFDQIKLTVRQKTRGLRDFKVRLQLVQALRAETEKSKAELEERAQAARDSAEALSVENAHGEESADRLASEVAAIMKDAKARLDALRKSAEAAGKSFDEASALMVRAITAAQKRVADARRAISEAGAAQPDARLEMISKDSGTEAAMRTVHGEIDYHAAQAIVLQLNSLTAFHEMQVLAAKEMNAAAADKVPSIDKEVEKHRYDADKKLNSAIDAYDNAAKALAGASVRTSDGKTLSGAVTVWQAQVGQAAALLLRSHVAKDEDFARGDREAAYKLLCDAAKGRENSPLLAPAIDMVLHLQRTAAE